MEVSMQQEMILEGSRNTALFHEGMRAASQAMQEDSLDAFAFVLARLQEMNARKCSPPKSDGDIVQLAYRCCREASTKAGDERDVASSVLSRLEPHFDIFEEQWGTHWSGTRLRIDAIIKPKDDSLWKTKSPRMGLEFKNFRRFDPSLDMKDYTKWYAQCHDYAETNFDDHGFVYVFSYNGFSHYRARFPNSPAPALAERFWGRIGVGELQPGFDGYPRKPSLILRINGTNKIWSEVAGVKDGQRMSMERKFGSR
jgi:hypothetical protein